MEKNWWVGIKQAPEQIFGIRSANICLTPLALTPAYMLKMHIVASKVLNEFTNKLMQNASEHQFCQKI